MKKMYSLQEAAQHNTRENCWVIVDGKVYDVTQFMDEHPGGDDVLINAAGRDAKEDFNFVGHSERARELMQSYYIGELELSNATIPGPKSCTKQEVELEHTNASLRYWVATVAIVGFSVVVGLLYFPES